MLIISLLNIINRALLFFLRLDKLKLEHNEGMITCNSVKSYFQMANKYKPSYGKGRVYVN